MIEVLDMKKSFKTGEEVIKKKLKDQSFTKGVATINLYDENNNLIEQTKSTNFIKNDCTLGMLYGNMFNFLTGSLTSSTFTNRFQAISLRKGDFEEDPNEHFMKGSHVAYAYRNTTSPGSKTDMGVYNQNESHIKITSDGYYNVRSVFDFGTSQGNGEFNHIYWCPEIGSTSQPLLFTSVIEPGKLYDCYQTGMYIDAFNNYLVKQGENYYKITNKDKLLSGLTKYATYDLLKPIPQYHPSCYRYGDDKAITISQSYLEESSVSARECNVTIKIHNETEQIKEISIDMFNDTLFRKINESLGTNRGRIYLSGWKILPDGKILMKFNAYTNSSTFKFDGFDAEGNPTQDTTMYYLALYDVATEEWILCDPENPLSGRTALTDLYNYPTYKSDENRYYLFSSKEIYTLDLEDYTSTVWNGSYYTYSFIRGIDFKNCICMSTASTPVRFLRMRSYTAHTKLPSPIVKTKTTTMKIIYDYYIQIPNTYAEEGKEFEWDTPATISNE